MNKKGFTLVEILIVIVVFGTGILGILTMLTNSIGYFDTINMQTRATLLAKEALEIAYNHRDGNLIQGYPWNYVGYQEWANGWSEQFWQPGEVYKVGFTWNGQYLMEKSEPKSDFSEAFQSFTIALDTQGSEPFFYRYLTTQEKKSDSEQKGFARWIAFSPVKDESGTPFDSKKLLKISAHTLYQRGNTTGEVVLESFIWLKDSTIEE